MEKTKREPRPKQYEEQVINIGRVTKVTKGGRHFRFSATVVVGDRKGKVGLGTRTIPHEAIGVRGASKVMLRPAAEGTGVKAGGPVRAVLELAGVKDILSKSLGSNTKINMAYATLEALKSQRTIEEVAKLRGKKVEEIR